MKKHQISSIAARQILDSRGNPTLEVSVLLRDGACGVAKVPSGASTGQYEALELRDGGKAYLGKGVTKARDHINTVIAPTLTELGCVSQDQVDAALIGLDGTDDKSRLGANAMLGVSLAFARAGAVAAGMPLYRYLGGITARRLPVPMMNILNGGAHATNNIDIQEFMIMPVGFPSYREALRAGTEIYHALGKLLRDAGLSTGVGDEGGFAPNLPSDEDALDMIVHAIERAGYSTDTVKLAIDAAASEWQESGAYRLPKRGTRYTTEELCDYFESLRDRYPIVSMEDALGETDFDGWSKLTARIGTRTALVGDDLFVTNPKRLREGIERAAGNAILIKPNQIGTLSETLEVIRIARDAGYKTIISHRSGETDDTTIADIAVATNAGYIKTGAPCRGERVAKYNRLLRIEEEIPSPVYGG